MKKSKHFNRKRLAVSIATLLSPTVVFSQVTAQENEVNNSRAENTEVIEVRGIRGSVTESMNLKRESPGVVDAISAEDIGKFPDTNLAESLQRITGVSISRQNGEGAQVTVRGFGADKNMVTLNSRVMPAADAFAGGEGTTRAFNFANLASEGVRTVEVYKTSRASIATGGIGATINIDTLKPLQTSGINLSIGAKAAHDTTNEAGDDWNPELSGIFSYVSDDETWGVAVNGIYQARDSGSASTTVDDWRVFPWVPNDFSNIPIADGVNGENTTDYYNSRITNAPAEGQLFALPNDVRYVYADRARTRTNGQITFQYSPNDNLITTLDYTYALNKITEDRGEKINWLTRTEDAVTFDTDHPVATAIIIDENVGGTKDLGFSNQINAVKNELSSLGFNAQYYINEDWDVRFDYHDSSMDSSPDTPLAGASSIHFQSACACNLTQRHDFSGDFPILTETIDDSQKGNGNGVVDAGDLGSQWIQIYHSSQRTDVNQFRIDSSYQFDEGGFDFGIELRSEEMKQKWSRNALQMGDWGVNFPGDVPDELYMPFDYNERFDDYNVGNASTIGLTGTDVIALGEWGAQHYGHEFAIKDDFDEDHMVEEDTFAAYFQVDYQGEIGGMPFNILTGVRYEKTDVTSTSNIVIPEALVWMDNNDFELSRGSLLEPISVESDYDHLLPSLDFDIEPIDNVKARFSFSQTIARANYNQLRTSVSNLGSNSPSSLGGVPTASAANPKLVPLKSNNFDLSVEYYFAESSYVSIGYYDKRVSNFIGTTQQTESHFGLRDVTIGQRAQAARQELEARGLQVTETSLFVMTAVLDNPNAFPNGADDYNSDPTFAESVAANYDIVADNTDPETEFLTSRPVNNRDANIHGFEFAVQHFFGDTGFGVAANYTTVTGDIGFDVTASPSNSQFALTGLSDSGNLVLMYEKNGIQARVAYNWRDEFLAGTSRGQSRSPTFIEDYSQIDASISYDISENFVVSLEGINLTGEDSRSYARSPRQVWDLYELGPRYQVGVRYSF